MKKLVLMLAQCLLLAGCTGLPQPREMGEMALLRTVGVDAVGDEVSLTVSTGPRATGVEGQKQSALVLKGEGSSLPAAALQLRQKSDNYVFFGYVDKLLLGQQPGSFLNILGWFAQDGELGLGAKIWLLRNSPAGEAVKSGGEDGVEGRLSALTMDDRLSAAPMTRTAGEVYIALLDRGCAYLPALSAGEELSPAGYAVLREEEIAGFLEGDAARGLELLAERPPAQMIEVELPENRVSLRLSGAQLDCKPVFSENKLVQIELTSRVEVKLEQWKKKPDGEQRELLRAEVERMLGEKIELALAQLQNWSTDCVGIGSRVGIAAPWHWNELEKNWPAIFAQVDYSIEVKAALGA